MIYFFSMFLKQIILYDKRGLCVVLDFERSEEAILFLNKTAQLKLIEKNKNKNKRSFRVKDNY